MKKLFISCPMKGRTEENIKKGMEKMHQIAEIVFDQELEAIDSWIEDDAPESVKNHDVWYLGKSIELLSTADYFIGVEYEQFWEGCDIETRVAQSYGIPCTLVDARKLMPDVEEVLNEYWRNMGETRSSISV